MRKGEALWPALSASFLWCDCDSCGGWSCIRKPGKESGAGRKAVYGAADEIVSGISAAEDGDFPMAEGDWQAGGGFGGCQ